MRCAMLGSGSGGNATLVSAGDTSVLIDCGYPVRALEERAQELAVDLAALTAILVTHEHGDHLDGVEPLAKRHGIPVYATRGTRVAAEARYGPRRHWHEISSHDSFTLGTLAIQPVPVPHDAREPSQFIFRDSSATLGILTDIGTLTPHVITQYRACTTLLLEFNHDPALLADFPYPAKLKRRIAGNYGHLSNAQAQDLLRAMRSDTLRHVIAAHLSERTNRPEIVDACLDEVSGTLPHPFTWGIAAQDRVLGWFDA